MENDRNKIIGERVRQYRKAREMTMEEVGKRLSRPVTAQGMALYETAQTRIPADILCEISLILHCDVRNLAGMEHRAAEGSQDWEAENYKAKLLRLRKKTRQFIYRIIDLAVATKFQPPRKEDQDDGDE